MSTESKEIGWALTSMSFPKLYGKTSKGATKVWSIETEGDTIVTTYGQLDGKMQTSRKVAKGKNIGKSNETTPEQQAVLEAESTWKKKKDKGYVETREETSKEVFLPMLAKDFEKQKGKINYPAYAQPKFDGVRCMAYWDGDEVNLMSRSGKTYNVPHIKEGLEATLPKNLVLDGELYAEDKSFQEVTRLVKKNRPESTDLKLFVYDCLLHEDRDMQFKNRYDTYTQWGSNVGTDFVRIVRCATVTDEADVYHRQRWYVAGGYEGAIVRNMDGVYKLKHRSNDLLKVKSWMDQEYKIVGFLKGSGKFSECPIWLCETEDGATFKVTPKGTFAERKAMLMSADIYLGKMLKVKYFELTEDGIPRFPIGEGIRMVKDMS